MKFYSLLTATLAVAASACIPRAFNDSNKSQLKNTGADLNFDQWFGSLPTGPIANYELTASVVFHKVGSELLPDFMSKAIPNAKMDKRLDVTLTGANKGSVDGGTSMVWMRDYQPIAIKSADPKAGGKTRFVSYYSINPARNSYTGSSGQNSMATDLFNPQTINIDREVIGGQRDSISLVRMPLLLEGGNLVATGDHVFLTEHIYEQNSLDYLNFLNRSGRSFDKTSLEKMYNDNGFYKDNGLGDKFEYRTPEQVKSVLAKYLEVPLNTIVTLPMMPGEGTKHIDLYLLAIGKKRVMIPEITEEGINMLAFENEKPLARTARDFLNEQAERLKNQYGYQVDRLTMLPPLYQIEQNGEKRAVYFSPANVLLANLDSKRKKVFVPHFEVPSDWGQQFPVYAQKVEEQWKNYFAQNGWEPIFVNANKAARAYGLIRCLTAPVPFLSEQHMKRFVQLGY